MDGFISGRAGWNKRGQEEIVSNSGARPPRHLASTTEDPLGKWSTALPDCWFPTTASGQFSLSNCPEESAALSFDHIQMCTELLYELKWSIGESLNLRGILQKTKVCWSAVATIRTWNSLSQNRGLDASHGRDWYTCWWWRRDGHGPNLTSDWSESLHLVISRGDLSCTGSCLVSLVSTFYSFPASPPLLQPLTLTSTGGLEQGNVCPG